jgi:antitoxin CptB
MEPSELSRLKWRCRRGMRELDVMLLRYLEHVYPSAAAEEQAAFRHLLDLQDPEVYGLLLGRLAPETNALDRVLKSVRFKS